MAGSEKLVESRRLSELAEYENVVRLQREIWGFDETDILPLRFMVVANRVGGQVYGAFDEGEMVAFLVAIPGVKPGPRPYLHSHMLGVQPAYRDLGIGRRLKLRQREEALSRGIGLIEWTFDPLQLKNAFFNIERLGVVVRGYTENQYGITGSPLHGGLPTDRCHAEWWIDSRRVRSMIEGEAHERRAIERISYPTEIERIRKDESAAAREIQLTNAEKFQSAFQRGLAVTGFERGDAECAYLLEPWP